MTTQVNSKFSIGDKVWLMHDNYPQDLEIVGITANIGVDTCYVIYNFINPSKYKGLLDRGINKGEHMVFKTKAELVASL